MSRNKNKSIPGRLNQTYVFSARRTAIYAEAHYFTRLFYLPRVKLLSFVLATTAKIENFFPRTRVNNMNTAGAGMAATKAT